MEVNQQEIMLHKNKLFVLINNLINTQLINDEIYINNEIKKVSEFLNSLLNIKLSLLNQINQINNFNNVLNFNQCINQPNLINNMPPVNINIAQQPLIQKNLNDISNNEFNNFIANVSFHHVSGKITNIVCKSNEKLNEIIGKYRKKANDNNKNYFIYNSEKLDEFSNVPLIDIVKSKNINITITVGYVENLL